MFMQFICVGYMYILYALCIYSCRIILHPTKHVILKTNSILSISPLHTCNLHTCTIQLYPILSRNTCTCTFKNSGTAGSIVSSQVQVCLTTGPSLSHINSLAAGEKMSSAHITILFSIFLNRTHSVLDIYVL